MGKICAWAGRALEGRRRALEKSRKPPQVFFRRPRFFPPPRPPPDLIHHGMHFWPPNSQEHCHTVCYPEICCYNSEQVRRWSRARRRGPKTQTSQKARGMPLDTAPGCGRPPEGVCRAGRGGWCKVGGGPKKKTGAVYGSPGFFRPPQVFSRGPRKTWGKSENCNACPTTPRSCAPRAFRMVQCYMMYNMGKICGRRGKSGNDIFERGPKPAPGFFRTSPGFSPMRPLRATPPPHPEG